MQKFIISDTCNITITDLKTGETMEEFKNISISNTNLLEQFQEHYEFEVKQNKLTSDAINSICKGKRI